MSVYADDLVILGSERNGVKCVKDKLGSSFELTGFGEISYCSGVTFKRRKKVIGLQKVAYSGSVLKCCDGESELSADFDG